MIYCCFPSFKVWQLPNTACTILILWLFDYNCNTNYARISSVKLIVSWRSFLATKTFILSRSRWGTSKIYRIVKGEKGPNPRTWKMSGYNYHMGKQTKKKGMHFPPSWIPVSGRALTGVWSKSYRTKLPACFLAFCFAAVEVERLAGQWAGLPGQPLDTTHPCCSCSPRPGSPGWAPAVGMSDHGLRVLQGKFLVPKGQRNCLTSPDSFLSSFPTFVIWRNTFSPLQWSLLC